MAEQTLPAGWPRMPIDEATLLLSRLWELSPQAAAEHVSTDVDGRRFYATAPTRVNKTRLDQLRNSVLELAVRHGFPSERRRRTSTTFDQELAALFATSVPMLPVEAADEEVWAFITLSVLPDVAIWRWPAKAGEPDRTIIEDGDTVRSDSRTLRLLGPRRGVFRQAWWRGYLLGADACLLLDEDNFINLTDRVSLTGYRLHSKLITQAHLDRLGRSGYDRRFALRRALILIGREFGRLAVEALPEDRVAIMIDTAFERAERDIAREEEEKRAAKAAALTQGSGSVAGTRPAVTDVNALEAEAGDRDSKDGPEALRSAHEIKAAGPDSRTPAVDARTRFLRAAAPYAAVLEPVLVPVGHSTMMSALFQAEQHVRALGGERIATRIYDDLSDVTDDWVALDDDERSIVYAALMYFVENDDITADSDPDGLLDDDHVVDCAFAALGRERSLS